MIDKKWTFIAVAYSLLIIVGCTSGQKNEEVSVVVDSFYANEPLADYRLVNKNYISVGLSDLLLKAAVFQKQDSARLKLAGSTDKPMMIEGDIFTSVLEGSTGHIIEMMDVQSQQARVTVAFTNNQYEKLSWKDTVLLVKEAGGWKIDDVLFTKGKGGGKGTRDVLVNFVSQQLTQQPDTQQNDSSSGTLSAAVKLRTGNHNITLQWIGWKKPGVATITDLNNNTYKITGEQIGSSKDEYLTINGILTPYTVDSLQFEGRIATKTTMVNNNKECVREGKYLFQSGYGKKYWRLQQMTNCEGGMVKDYIDIYF